jgi:hypothetical protein
VTEQDQSRDRPGDEMTHVPVAEAAKMLGITEAGVRKRVQREQIPYDRDKDGRLWVWVSPGETRQAESRDEPIQSRDELLDELRDRLRDVEAQLQAEREAHAESRRLLLAALEKIPPAIEAPNQEPRESPETATEGTMEPTPSEPSRSTQPPTERPWWGRVFGG